MEIALSWLTIIGTYRAELSGCGVFIGAGKQASPISIFLPQNSFYNQKVYLRLVLNRLIMLNYASVRW
jgi:hypothetical protein